ncbi:MULTISPECIES: carbohydrate ABC transporter permease [Thermoactinomyces]|uniref:Sugar ABC transporter permease n=1 Tax=Thermoactinomyces daqus TaxID=1329516 RepID=A0A7W1X8Y4_9BACL|nr:sugar ABC transporter permease [Thermoactinomyces daqus]MBA4542197.1 sugar ABC transporter permease [Thermoactinomyces daqus]MBH8604476.1 sugar ABC transporter permease [Thermoactinomyces sp. CICC 10522]MBH8607523.1 sugar ABC transporter permease [Thermoactinomyces sp. CICC 10521]
MAVETVPPPEYSGSKKKRKKIPLLPYLFLLPALALFFTFDYLPIFSAFYYSFTEFHVISPAEWVGLENYRTLLHDPRFWTAAKNSMTYFLIIVPMLITLPLFLAILVNQKLRGIQLFRVIYYLPVITSMVAVAIVWKYLYHPAGLLNAILQELGLQKEAVNWLLNPRTSLPAVALLEGWKSMGFYMVIYLAGLQSIAQELVEAARIDGANRLRVLWHVYLPQLRPTIAVTLVLATLGSVQMFTSIYIMTGGGPLDSTLSLPLYIYQKAFVELDMGYATAMGMVLWLILMILTFINFKLSRGGQV